MRLRAKRLFNDSKSAREKLREKLPKLTLVNSVNEIVNLTADRQIAKVSKDWFSELEI